MTNADGGIFPAPPAGREGNGSLYACRDLRMGCFAIRTGGVAAALIGFCGLLVSCNARTSSSAHLIHAAVAPERAAARLDVPENFEMADLEKRFEDVARRAASSVVAISATEATVDADDSL